MKKTIAIIGLSVLATLAVACGDNGDVKEFLKLSDENILSDNCWQV